jgi:hypothetical protein
VSANGAGIVHALFAPAKKDDSLLYVRARLDGHGTPAEFEFSPPDAKVDAWGIGAVENGAPIVLARARTSLLVGGPSRTGWTKLADLHGDAAALRVIRFHGYWAEWFEPACGLRHARIR